MTERQPIRILANAVSAPRIRADLTRRSFLATFGAFAASGALAACAGPARETRAGVDGEPIEDKLLMYTWGEYDDPEVLDEFRETFNTNFIIDAFGSNEELISKLVGARGTSGYDIVVPTGGYIGAMAEHGLIEPLDHSLIPNMKHVLPELMSQPWDPENKYSILKSWGTTGFVYDTTKIKRELKDWNDFFDCAMNEASGKVSMIDDPQSLVGTYFWANKYSTNDDNAAHFDEAEDFLVNKLAPHISAFDSYPGSGAIPQGTQWLFQSWNSDARLGILESPDPERWRWVVGAPHSELWMDNWCIAAGAQHPKAAHAFLNFVLEPDVAYREVDYIGSDVGVQGVRERAEQEGMELPEMVFFDADQVESFKVMLLTESQQRFVDIWNAVKGRAAN